MNTAFQADAFQNNAFQIDVAQVVATPAVVSWYQRPVPRRVKPVEEDEALLIRLIS